MKITTFFLISGLLVGTHFSLFADAPVEDLVSNHNNNTATVTRSAISGVDLLQRVARLEKMLASQGRLINKVNTLQQDIQQLRGSIEVLHNYNQRLQQNLQKLEARKKLITPVAVSDQSKAQLSKTWQQRKAYQQAYQLISTKKYDQAAVALEKFIKHYPNSEYVANAHYWLGEVYYTQGKKMQAMKEFNAVIEKFTQNRKVPDAKLKKAFLYYDKGDINQAKQQLQQVEQQYPNSAAAQLAAAKLRAIKILRAKAGSTK